MDEETENRLLKDVGFIRGKIEGICTEQEDNKREHIEMRGQSIKHGEDISALKVKSGMWGFGGGIIAVLAKWGTSLIGME